MRKINLGLIGLGTIGEGVYKLLKSQKNRIKKIYDIDIDLVKSCDISQNLRKKLKIEKKFFTNNYSDLINDSNIQNNNEKLIEDTSLRFQHLEELKNAITRLKDDLNLRNKLGVNAMEKYKKKFTFKEDIKNINSLIRTL